MAEVPLVCRPMPCDTRVTRSTAGMQNANTRNSPSRLHGSSWPIECADARLAAGPYHQFFARIYRSATEFAERWSLPCDAPTGQSYRAPRALIAWVFRLCWAVCHAWICAIHLFLGRAVDTLSLPKWARRWIRSTVAYSQLFVCCFYVGHDRRCA